MRVIFGEWSPDKADLENPCLDAKNVIASAGRYTEFLGLSAISNALAAAPLGAIASSIISGTLDIYAGTASALYLLSGASWTDKTGAALTSATSWEFCQFGKYVLAASYENLVRQVTVASGASFAAITDSPKARHIAAVRNFVMCGDIDDPTDGAVPWRVRWSVIDDPISTWPLAGTNAAYAGQSDEQDLHAEDGAVQAIVGTEFGLIFQEKAITRASYVGSPIVFQMDRIDSTRGAISAGSVVNVGGICYFLSRDGFFANDGSGPSVSIGHAKVDKWVQDQLDDNTVRNIRGGADPRRKVVFWAFPANGSQTLNRIIIYNYAEERWTYADVDLTGIVYARQPGYTLEQVDTFSSSIDALATPLDDPFWGPGGQFLAAFDSTYKLATFNGDALTAVLETGEFGLEGERGYLDGVRPLVTGTDATTVTVELGTRNLMGSSVVWTAARSITPATGKVDFRNSSFFFRLRVNIAGGFDSALGIDAMAVKDDAGR